MWLNLTFLWFGPPFANRKDWTGFAELRENQISVLIKSLQFLAKSATQSKRFDLNLEEEHVLASLDELGKVCHGADELLEFGLRARSDTLVGTVHVVTSTFTRADRDDGGGILCSLRNFLSNRLLVTQTLVIYSKTEKLVEVEVVLHEEANVACLELHGSVAHDLGVGPDVGIKRSRRVC